MTHTGSTFLGVVGGLRNAGLLLRQRSPTNYGTDNDCQCDEKDENSKKSGENFNRLLGIRRSRRRARRFVRGSLTSGGGRSGALRAR